MEVGVGGVYLFPPVRRRKRQREKLRVKKKEQEKETLFGNSREIITRGKGQNYDL